MNNRSERLGSAPIPKLLLEQAVPASIGILVLSIYGIVDTIFVGQFVGPLAIGATTVVFPITLLIGSIGMAIGIGGASIISRALGAGDSEKAQLTFSNQAILTLSLAGFMVLLSSFFIEEILTVFGAQGQLMPMSMAFFKIIIFGIPFLAWGMMSNHVIRSEGRAKMAMLTMLIPAIANIILVPIFIVGLDMGIEGAAWATTLSYIGGALYSGWYFIKGKSELKLAVKNLKLNFPIVKEIFSIGIVTFARQGTIALLFVVLNQALFKHGGELAISTYGIVNRVMLIANFPILGLTQGFLPIAGYNFGAKNFDRVKSVIKSATFYGTCVAVGMFAIIMTFTPSIISIFTKDESLLRETRDAVRIVFLATPTLCVQLIGAAYYQAIGKAIPALLLTLTKQGFCLIPFLLILPPIFGLKGIWYAFPIADVITAIIVFWYLRIGMKKLVSAPIVSYPTEYIEDVYAATDK